MGVRQTGKQGRQADRESRQCRISKGSWLFALEVIAGSERIALITAQY
jgi:hypothetical protein